MLHTATCGRRWPTRRPTGGVGVSSWERPAAALPERGIVADPAGRITRRQAALSALAPLSRAERTVVVLRYYEDLTVPEIARVMAVPAGTVKSTCARRCRSCGCRPSWCGRGHDERRTRGRPA
ncbi:sigma factor-like helix-turn-helix DNA-binding protein [Actinomycetes bacterium KLBMP 9759]